jgi:hypothetical protein
MAETNQGVFFNPQTENVVGQAYNDLVFSQQERINEEKAAAQLAAAANAAGSTAASKADKERLDLLKEQAKAAQKDADARKKEVSSAIKNIDVVPNAMYNAYAAPMRDAAKYLADNMDQLIEQYGVDKVSIYTEQLNNASDEIKAAFRPTFNKAKNLLDKGQRQAGISGSKGFVESFSEEDYNSGMSMLNNPNRFKIKFEDGWKVQDSAGSDISFSDWVKAGYTEPSELFQSKPKMAFSKTVIEAWSKFPLTKNLKQEDAMDSFIENQLRDPESVHRLTAMNEYYVNQDPEKALPYDELFSESNAGAERIDEAVQNYKDKWMELYREALKKDERTSGSTSLTGEEIIRTSTINTEKSDVTKENLAKMFMNEEGPVSPALVQSMGIKGVAELPRDANFGLTGLDARNQELFGVNEPDIKVQSLAFNLNGNLFVGYKGMLTPEVAASAPNDDLLSTYGIESSAEEESELRGNFKVIEFGSEPWIKIMKEVGAKAVTQSRRDKVMRAFGDITDQEQANFYVGMMTVANSTNDQFLNNMIEDIVQEGGVSEAELREVASELNQ